VIVGVALVATALFSILPWVVGEGRSDFEREDAFSDGEELEQSGLARAIRDCY